MNIKYNATTIAPGEISFSTAMELCTRYDEARRYRGNEDDAPFTSTAHISADVNEKLSPAYEIFQAFGAFGYYDV